MEKELTYKQALKAIAGIASDEFCFDLEFAEHKKRLKTDIEKTCAKKIGTIYRIAHAFTSGCDHDNWKEEAKEVYDKYKKEGII